MTYCRYSPPNLYVIIISVSSIFLRKIGACASRLIPGPISGPGYEARLEGCKHKILANIHKGCGFNKVLVMYGTSCSPWRIMLA